MGGLCIIIVIILIVVCLKRYVSLHTHYSLNWKYAANAYMVLYQIFMNINILIILFPLFSQIILIITEPTELTD